MLRFQAPFKIYITTLFLVAISFLDINAQEERLRIRSVSVEGNIAADRNLILNSARLQTGDMLNAASIQDAIRSVYALGLFSDVLIEAGETERGADVIIKVVEYPKVVEIIFRGNSKLKAKDLKEKMSIFEGRIVSPKDIKDNVKLIKRLYEEKGYLLAEVESELQPTDQEGRVKLVLKIEENKKVKIKGINIIGNKIFSDKKVRGKMKNKKDSFWRSGNFNREEYPADLTRIVDFYKEEGYLDAYVVSDSIYYGEDKKSMYIDITISEGMRYRFGNFSFAGNDFYSTEELERSIEFEPFEVYSQKEYEKTMENLHTMYQDEGYWYARIDDEIIYSDGYTVNMKFRIAEGNPVYVNEVKIEGNTKTHDRVIRRELSIMPNTIFRRSVLGRSLRDVMILNYFANVVPDWEILPDGNIDLIIKVEEKPTGQASVGAGYSERDKLVGTIGLGIPNFRGQGQTLTLNWDFGSRRNSIDLGFTEPWLFNTPTSLGLNVYHIIRDYYGDFDERRQGFSIRVGRRLRWPDNYFTVYTRYRYEGIKFTDFSESFRNEHVDNPYSIINNPEYQTSSIAFTLVRDSRDLAQFATSGSVNSVTTELAGGLLGGDWNYHKEIFETKWYLKTFWNFVLIFRGKAGMIAEYDGGSGVPYSERFSPGGTDPDGQVRGYPDASIGPYDDRGAYLRGRSMVVYNVEYQIPISDQQLYALLFFDAGNAFEHITDLRPFDLQRSYGLGFRIVVPMVGIMGFDFGRAMDGREEGEWRPHFQIGRGF
ncbi:MAG: outer membrane protein assembly factor BamA [candidate division Zixibacteria bacterium]|nr:outer membrane protein assembly factor BamA [candidate division Zixibacteria bacterium]